MPLGAVYAVSFKSSYKNKPKGLKVMKEGQRLIDLMVNRLDAQ